MDKRTPQTCSADPQTGRGTGGASGRFRRFNWGAWAVAGPSVALLAVGGMCSFPSGVSGFWPGVFSLRLEAGQARDGVAQTEWRQFGPQAFSRVAAGGRVPAPLVLAGVSGEALAVSAEEAVPVFAPPQSAAAALIVAGPVSVSDQVTMAAVWPGGLGEGGFGGREYGLTAVRSSALGAGQRGAGDNMPVPDYALVFAQQPDFTASGNEGSANLEQAALRAGWRAVVETLILTAEPKPTAVHNL